jgi:DNA-binding transcriptional LysR family regulator
MKLRHLEFFVAVIECRGVSKAAEHLRVSQPAVSAALRSLEADLGQTLFDRYSGGRRSRPTPQALTFYEHACDILERCDIARRSLASDKGDPQRIGMGVLQTLPASEIARVYAALRRSASQWRWSLREGTESEVSSWLKAGRIDLAWTVPEEGARNAAVLWREPYVAMVSKHHALARSDRLHITVADLAGEPFILRESCELRGGALKSGGLKISPSARAVRDELALDLVAKGIGFAIAPRCLATADVAALAVTDLGLSRAIGLMWRPDCPQAAIDAVTKSLVPPAP